MKLALLCALFLSGSSFAATKALTVIPPSASAIHPPVDEALVHTAMNRWLDACTPLDPREISVAPYFDASGKHAGYGVSTSNPGTIGRTGLLNQDVVLALDGKPLYSDRQIKALCEVLKVNRRATLTVLRNNKHIDLVAND